MTKRRATVVALLSGGLLALAGCATSQQWAEWRSHSSHFASGQHASFSFRNQGAEAERVRTGDLDAAHGESWWGRQLPVSAVQQTGH